MIQVGYIIYYNVCITTIIFRSSSSWISLGLNAISWSPAPKAHEGGGDSPHEQFSIPFAGFAVIVIFFAVARIFVSDVTKVLQKVSVVLHGQLTGTVQKVFDFSDGLNKLWTFDSSGRSSRDVSALENVVMV